MRWSSLRSFSHHWAHLISEPPAGQIQPLGAWATCGRASQKVLLPAKQESTGGCKQEPRPVCLRGHLACTYLGVCPTYVTCNIHKSNLQREGETIFRPEIAIAKWQMSVRKYKRMKLRWKRGEVFRDLFSATSGLQIFPSSSGQWWHVSTTKLFWLSLTIYFAKASLFS